METVADRAANPWERAARLEKATKIVAAIQKARRAGVNLTAVQVRTASKETRQLVAQAAGVNLPSETTMQVVAELLEQADCTCNPFVGLPGNEGEEATFCVVHPTRHLRSVRWAKEMS